MENKFINKLKQRWNIKSTYQVIIILIVFACTGTSVMFIERAFLDWLGVRDSLVWYNRVLVFLLVTLPIYQVILLIYGFIFGQFRFFLDFEKKFFGRIITLFKKKKKGLGN
ncbi:MAG: DUF6787 family protein [Hyphomicrobiales bacterium]